WKVKLRLGRASTSDSITSHTSAVCFNVSLVARHRCFVPLPGRRRGDSSGTRIQMPAGIDPHLALLENLGSSAGGLDPIALCLGFEGEDRVEHGHVSIDLDLGLFELERDEFAAPSFKLNCAV